MVEAMQIFTPRSMFISIPQMASEGAVASHQLSFLDLVILHFVNLKIDPLQASFQSGKARSQGLLIHRLFGHDESQCLFWNY